MPLSLSQFAAHLEVETAFTVLAVARRLAAAGKRVIELEIGDSPFPAPQAAKRAGIDAIQRDMSHYCASIGLPEMRAAAADMIRREFGVDVTADNVVVGQGAKVFQLLFCQAILNPGDGVLVFSPHFPTYLPNIASRGARVHVSVLQQARDFRPNLDDVEAFLDHDERPRAIFLNSPHNPTGGVATQQDLHHLAELVRGRDVAVFSDEPYCHMVWQGRHHTLLAEPGMLEQCVAAYTFSKSYSMSGWRLGFAVSSPRLATTLGNLINVSLSCTPPLAQWAGVAALHEAQAQRDADMQQFRRKVELLAARLSAMEGVKCLLPAGAFYVFPNVAAICNRLGITSHGLAMYLLEGADDRLGVACLGGEAFGAAGGGFLRFSCAEPDERLHEAMDFLPQAWSDHRRVAAYLQANPRYRLQHPYDEP
jgi:aspartate aminotransferase